MHATEVPLEPNPRVDRKRWLGEIMLAQPVLISYWAWFSVFMIASFLVALYFIEYTRKERVIGQISSTLGIAKIMPPFDGVVVKKLVVEGQEVNAGQVLLVINAEKNSAGIGGTQIEISHQLRTRKKRLEEEVVQQQSISREEESALNRRIQRLKQESQQAQVEVDILIRKRILVAQTVERRKELLKQNFVAQAGVEEAEQVLLDVDSRLQSLARDQTILMREIETLESDLLNHPKKTSNRLSELERLIAAMAQDLAENEGRREIEILAPYDGIVSSLLIEKGQIAVREKPLLGVIPSNSVYEASIYVPSRAIGFIQRGQKVNLRLDAFPYQKFGQHAGEVAEIGKVTYLPEDLQGLSFEKREPLYKIIVKLDSQTVRAYGLDTPFRSGMTLEADVQLESRKLYEWILEPLYSMSGKI
jgi:membrane fusion protein